MFPASAFPAAGSPPAEPGDAASAAVASGPFDDCVGDCVVGCVGRCDVEVPLPFDEDLPGGIPDLLPLLPLRGSVVGRGLEPDIPEDDFPAACEDLPLLFGSAVRDGVPVGPPDDGLPPALGLPALGLPALGLPALGLPALGLPALGFAAGALGGFPLDAVDAGAAGGFELGAGLELALAGRRSWLASFGFCGDPALAGTFAFGFFALPGISSDCKNFSTFSSIAFSFSLMRLEASFAPAVFAGTSCF